ncbi:hypothetical protein C0431_14920 [bacterium]|jgi:hypothetical protein|nr:hypothetical protein [bacterium]
MKTRRIEAGVGTGGLHEYRWELLAEPEGHRVSVVGVCDMGVLGNAISRRDGIGRGVVLGDEERWFEPGERLVGGAGSWAVGATGFGEGGFQVFGAGDVFELERPAGASEMDVDGVSTSGIAYGSVVIRELEVGAVWRDGQCIVCADFIRVSAVRRDQGYLGRKGEGDWEVGETSDGSVVMIRDDGIFLVEGSGEMKELGVRGYRRLSVLGVGGRDRILGFGVTESGLVEHWVFELGLGITVLTGQPIGAGVVIGEMGGIGADGTMVGIAQDGSERMIVRLF